MNDLIKESASEFDKITDGIDKVEFEQDNGWWETSTGADFGAEKKKEILDWHTKQMEKAYEKGREDERKEIEELRRNEAIRSVQVPATMNGEWCGACGAWKQYGLADQHYCTGYKITC